MGGFILVHVFTTWMAIVSIGRLSEKEKDLEILVLRQQLAILQRKCHKPVKPNRAEKLTLAILAAKLKQATQRPTNQLQDFIRIFQPETVIRWHQELVRRKWTYQGKHKGGRPRIGRELDDLILMVNRATSIPVSFKKNHIVFVFNPVNSDVYLHENLLKRWLEISHRTPWVVFLLRSSRRCTLWTVPLGRPGRRSAGKRSQLIGWGQAVHRYPLSGIDR
jgi:hypothetical protein